MTGLPEESSSLVEFKFCIDAEGYWIDLTVNGSPYGQVGPFETPEERQRAHDDMLSMVFQHGAREARQH